MATRTSQSMRYSKCGTLIVRANDRAFVCETYLYFDNTEHAKELHKGILAGKITMNLDIMDPVTGKAKELGYHRPDKQGLQPTLEYFKLWRKKKLRKTDEDLYVVAATTTQRYATIKLAHPEYMRSVCDLLINRRSSSVKLTFDLCTNITSRVTNAGYKAVSQCKPYSLRVTLKYRDLNMQAESPPFVLASTTNYANKLMNGIIRVLGTPSEEKYEPRGDTARDTGPGDTGVDPSDDTGIDPRGINLWRPWRAMKISVSEPSPNSIGYLPYNPLVSCVLE